MTDKQQELTQEQLLEVNPDELKSVPHLGPISIKKLDVLGITSMRMLYTEMTEPDLKRATGMSDNDTIEVFEYIQKVLEAHQKVPKKVKTALELYEQQQVEPFVPTGCKALDGLFVDGVKGGYLTEFRGENGSGKTQVSIALAMSVLEEDETALVAYIDTERKLKLQRIVNILKAKGVEDPDKINSYLGRILLFSPNTGEKQLTDITNINSMIDAGANVKLFVIDSIISLFQNERLERGEIKSKFNLIKPMMRKLQTMAETYKLPIVCINTVYEKPDATFGKDPIVPAGGNSVGHVLAYRVKLEEVGSGKKHRATMVKSPEHAENQALFQITEKGIEDVKA